MILSFLSDIQPPKLDLNKNLGVGILVTKAAKNAHFSHHFERKSANKCKQSSPNSSRTASLTSPPCGERVRIFGFYGVSYTSSAERKIRKKSRDSATPNNA